MPKRTQDTAKVIKFFDDCFDNLNGGSFKAHPGKPLRGSVHRKSPHVDFWQQCVETLQHMHFIQQGAQKICRPPSLHNLTNTISGFLDLNTALSKRNLPYFLPRSFNQEPLENFFGQIRMHRGRNVNPTCGQFEDSFKALMMKGVTSPHSVAANCEETFTSSLLQLKNLVCKDYGQEICSGEVEEDPRVYQAIAKLSSSSDLWKPLHKAVLGYVSGYIARKVLKRFDCEYCKMHILCSPDKQNEFHTLILAKEYSGKQTLQYCNNNFIKCVYSCYNIAKVILANFCPQHRVRETILLYVRHFVQFSFIFEHKEEICNFIMNFLIQFCIYNFCKSLNRIISGKDSTISSKNCELYREAYSICKRNHKYRHVQ